MARCGRCGLWNAYPEDYSEKKYAGVCLWYQMRLTEDVVFDSRDCDEFIERVPQMTPLEHFEYKTDRDALGSAYRAAKRSKWLAYIALTLSLMPYIQAAFSYMLDH